MCYDSWRGPEDDGTEDEGEWDHLLGKRGWQTLGEHVRQRRKALHMSQEDLAARMGHDRSYISHIELNRAKRASYALLVQLADALEEPLAQLLEETGLEETNRETGPSKVSAAQERIIAYTRARLGHLSEEEADRLLKIVEAGFGECAPG